MAEFEADIGDTIEVAESPIHPEILKLHLKTSAANSLPKETDNNLSHANSSVYISVSNQSPKMAEQDKSLKPKPISVSESKSSVDMVTSSTMTTSSESLSNPQKQMNHSISMPTFKNNHSTLGQSLAPRPGWLVSQNHNNVSNDIRYGEKPITARPLLPSTTTSNNSTPVPIGPIYTYGTHVAQASAALGNMIGTPPNPNTSIGLGSGQQQLEPKTSASRAKQYTLSDGSMVSGKGLGSGRPGVKRGSKSSTNPNGDEPGFSPLSRTSSTSAILSSPMKKRKRADSESSNIKTRRSTGSSVASSSRESSVEYNPTTSQTRSGRQTQKPSTYVPPASTTSSPAIKRTQSDSVGPGSSRSPSSIKTHPKIKRRIYRGKEQFALCEHCLRGHGPVGNAIVFCDACNKCWHQRCHEPSISQEVISDSKADWFCTECDRILHGNKKAKKEASKQNNTASPAVEPPKGPIPMTFAGPLIGGAGIPKEQKLKYLNTFSKEKLVSLIMNASDLAPALPLFQAPVLVPVPAPLYVPQAKFTSNYVTPVSDPPTFATPTPAEVPDEGFYDYFDDHAALYPRPGSGIKLPPESVDMNMLLESKDSKTFSHWIRKGIQPV